VMHARTVLWRGLYLPGAEYCGLSRSGEGVLLEGTALLAVDNRPYAVTYRIGCDAGWNTRCVEVRARSGGENEQILTLAVDGQHRWWRGRDELIELAGCADVDLGFTPSTNTLPIRRLNLPIGLQREVTAAWVRFPELTVQPLRQRYTRLSGTLYRYESLDSGFRAEIEVDEEGLVVVYSGGWERIASGGR
jgi:uncharacterized protein